MNPSSLDESFLKAQVSVQRVDTHACAVVRPLATSNRSLELSKVLENEVWEISFSKKKRRLHLLESTLITPAAQRIKAQCAHFDACGGCQWQHVRLEHQHTRKEAFVLDQLKTYFLPTTTWHGMDFVSQAWRYRNKIELTFRENLKGEKFLGFHAGKYRVIDIKECHLAGTWSESVIEHAKKWWLEEALLAYHPGSDRGSLRSLTLRESKHTRDKMVVLTVSGNSDYALNRLQMDHFITAMQSTVEPEDTLSLYIVVHQAIQGQPTRLFEWHLAGPESITEKLFIAIPNQPAAPVLALEFAISPTTFFQPNTQSAQKLYGWALNFASRQKEKPLVWDLFCGSGTLSLAIASLARKVIGVEINPMAVLDAKANASRNGVENASFECFDLHKSPALAIETLIQQAGKPDLVVVDPPRAGVMEKGIHLLAGIAPKSIVYVSCNPVSQAKDIQALKDYGYQLVEAVGIDQFPHTSHVETVCLLEKK
jgi:23S rRNA (uracil1939-C5)-methyltransferase